jgi:hypothetical protein
VCEAHPISSSDEINQFDDIHHLRRRRSNSSVRAKGLAATLPGVFVLHELERNALSNNNDVLSERLQRGRRLGLLPLAKCGLMQLRLCVLPRGYHLHHHPWQRVRNGNAHYKDPTTQVRARARANHTTRSKS